MDMHKYVASIDLQYEYLKLLWTGIFLIFLNIQNIKNILTVMAIPWASLGCGDFIQFKRPESWVQKIFTAVSVMIYYLFAPLFWLGRFLSFQWHFRALFSQCVNVELPMIDAFLLQNVTASVGVSVEYRLQDQAN